MIAVARPGPGVRPNGYNLSIFMLYIIRYGQTLEISNAAGQLRWGRLSLSGRHLSFLQLSADDSSFFQSDSLHCRLFDF